MKKLSLAYFGSPNFAASFLEKIVTDVSINRLIEVKYVITQSDQPVGRKRVLTPTPVKQYALKIKNLEIENSLKIENLKLKISKCDIALVYAYGDLIPKELLNLPKYGFWNIHPSLLPKYRGPSPIATPLINGDEKTGVTIIKMDEEIDHGPIIVQESLTIENDDKRPDLEKKLTTLAFEMFKKIIKELRIANYELKTKEQNHNDATYTKKLNKQDGFISFNELKNIIRNPQFVIKNKVINYYNLYRGLYEWPGLWTLLRQGFGGQAKRLKIVELKMENRKLKIVRVQLEGKNEVNFETFNEAYKIF